MYSRSVKFSVIKSLRGHSSVTYRNFFWKLDPHSPPRNANNIEHYTFVTLFLENLTHPYPHLRYVTLEWSPCPLDLLSLMLKWEAGFTFPKPFRILKTSSISALSLFSSDISPVRFRRSS